jgi:hypothetical protein
MEYSVLHYTSRTHESNGVVQPTNASTVKKFPTRNGIQRTSSCSQRVPHNYFEPCKSDILPPSNRILDRFYYTIIRTHVFQLDSSIQGLQPMCALLIQHCHSCCTPPISSFWVWPMGTVQNRGPKQPLTDTCGAAICFFRFSFLTTHMYTVHLFLQIFHVTPIVRHTSHSGPPAIFRALCTPLKVAYVSFRLHNGATYVWGGGIRKQAAGDIVRPKNIVRTGPYMMYLAPLPTPLDAPAVVLAVTPHLRLQIHNSDHL